MRIERGQAESTFETFAGAASGILIGAPGSGKSYTLKRFAESKLEDPSKYVFFVPVDRFPEISEASLSAELAADGRLFGFLEDEAAGASEAYFVVDALDAARSDRGRTELLSLLRRALRQLSEKWRVIVSVRTYDALRSEELEGVFGPTDMNVPEAFRLDGVVCRHFFLPPLSDEEIRSAEDDIPGLAQIWASATPERRDILRTPFCLWLLERIVSSGGEAEISDLRSEVELLELFWRLRVDAGDLGVERRLILERVTAAMLAEQTLSLSTSAVYRSSEQAAWHELHSNEVLASTTSGHLRTSFGHNILFDFAVSTLSLDTTPGDLRRFLEVDPSRALFLRPSLNYFFLRLWYHERSAFWEMLFDVAASTHAQVRLFTRVLPPTVVANEARSGSDLDPLLERLDSDDAAAPDAVLHVLQALRFAGVPRPEVWVSVCDRLATRATREFAWELALVLDHLNRTQEPDLRTGVGSSARTLLRWAFAERPQNPMADRLGSVWLVPLVAQTIETDPRAASELLAQVVNGIGDASVPVDYAYRLADQLDKVWPTAPELAAEFFHRSFAHAELSEERTHMGGIVIALSSTRRQDFEMVQWVLKRHAAAFLGDEPTHAIPAIVKSINAQIRMRELADQETPPAVSRFAFCDLEATYTRDASHFWDASGAVRDDQQELMDAVVQYLDAIADAGETEAIRDRLGLIGRHAEMAFVWRRLLDMAAGRPETYAEPLLDLLVAPPILSGLETVREAAEFLGAALPYLPDDASLAIERAVVSIAQGETDVEDAPIGRLIQRFPDERLQTAEGRELKNATQSDVNAQTNRPLVEFHMSSQPYTEGIWLAEQGVDVADRTVRRLTEAAAPVGAFEDEYRNTTPAREAIVAVLADIQRVLAELATAEDLPEAVADSIWAKLGGAAALLARQRAELEPDELAIVRRVLLDSAAGRAPSPETAGEFTSPSWSPAARNAAAQGLPLLVAADDDEIVSALRSLAVDPVPSVRWLVAADLWQVCEPAPEVFWDIAHTYLETETNATVLDAAARSLGAVASVERQPQVEAALQILLAREDFVVGEQRRFKPEDHLSSLLVGLAIGRGSPWAQQIIRAPLDALPARAAEASGYAWFALQFLHVDRVDIPDFEESAQRALEWLKEAVVRSTEAIRASTGAENQPETLKETFAIVDDVVSRLYFNSGVYEGSDRPRAPAESVCQFFTLTRGLLGVVAEEVGGANGTGLPASTAHHFVELMHGVVQCDPTTVTHFVRLVVAAATGSGYAFDSLASREVTQLVEELLADHREALRDGQPLDDLMFLLDTFVAAGWPEAQHLVFRLEEIFR